jgi:major inositol transporter-like SP family MFS transporter
LPLRIRGTAMGVAIFLHWLANFAIAQTFPVLLSAVGLDSHSRA